MEKIKTGIPGFDEIAGGGFIKNRNILVQGEAGTGKTTFSMQYLVEGIRQYNENGLFISLEYDPIFLIEDMKAYNWSINEYTRENKLSIVAPKGGLENPSNMNVDDLINFIFEETDKVNAKRLVIDSLNSLEFIFSKTENYRKEMIRFNSLIGDLECTTLLISELHNNIYTYLSHGVINLFYTKVGANRLRGIEVRKMRGTQHSSYTHAMLIQDSTGIEVLPTEIDFNL